MSGGRWCYNQSSLGYEMFPGCDVCYGLGRRGYLSDVKRARKLNPLENKQLSELAYDMLCLIHSADWYLSGDTGEDTYLEDVKFFKEKWLGVKPDDMVRAEIDKCVLETKEELYRELLYEHDGDSGQAESEDWR